MSKQLKELRKLSKDEREKRINETRLQLMKDRTQAASGAAGKKTSSIRQSKKTIARLLTLRNE